ncbi:MAG: small multi-drug export protein [Candidatus Micrarchaeota archaeon]|nr:small multi-drug export protein [Candidatus Micrarchaeota archaeon]
MLNESISFLIQHAQDPLIISLILGALPVSEVRGAAIYAFSIGKPDLILFAILSNILVCPLILIFWKILRIRKLGEIIIGKSLKEKLHRFSKQYESQGMLAIIIFVGIPFPATGVYTATFLAELLGISRWKILLSSVIGVLLSALIMSLLLSNIF